MDPVIIVSGNWVKKHRYVFNPDGRGCRVVHINEKTTLDELAKIVLDDYGLKESSHQIQLSYTFSNKTLKTMAHDTPPVYLSNTRQLQVFLSLRKNEHLRLCSEITENEISRNDGAREKNKRLFSYSSEVESRYEEDYSGSYDGFNLEDEVEEDEAGEEDEVVEDDEVGEENEVVESNEVGEEDEEDEEDDEFESRFDMFDDSDGESSEDDNFSLYGDSPTEDEDSATLPPKKRSKGNPEVPRLDMSSLNLSVGQRYESKADLEKRLKLLTVKDRFDFDVDVSDSDTLVVKCWVDGCLWRVRATTLGDPPTFYVRIYDSDHTCSITERSGRSRKATAAILGELYKDFLGDVGPSVRPRSVAIAIQKQFGVKVIISTLRLT